MRPEKKQLRLSVSSRGLRIWGMLFLLCGMVGRGIVQNVLLNVDELGMDKISQLLEQDPNILKYSTLAVIMQGLETMALPVFVFLLVEGFRHTGDFKAYLTRMFGAAVLAEIPYNLVTTGKVFALESRNPLIGLVIGLVALLFISQRESYSVKNYLTKGLIFVAAALWSILLGIQYGVAIVVMLAALWFFRSSRNKQVIAGIAACVICGFLSYYFYAATLGVLFLLLYTGERSYSENKWVNYLSYPVMLLAVGIAARLL